MAGLGEVDADLVGASSFEPGGDQVEVQRARAPAQRALPAGETLDVTISRKIGRTTRFQTLTATVSIWGVTIVPIISIQTRLILMATASVLGRTG